MKSTNKLKMSIFDEAGSDDEQDTNTDDFFKKKPVNQETPLQPITSKVIEKAPGAVVEQQLAKVEAKPLIPGKIANNPFEVKNAVV